MKKDRLQHADCPICGKASDPDPLLSLQFPRRRGLPDEINLLFCESCDFAYASPCSIDGYIQYYGMTCNDQMGSRNELAKSAICQYRNQVDVVAPFLDKGKSLRVLDIGCGRAGLLHALRHDFPQHCYTGADPAVGTEGVDQGIEFRKDWEAIRVKFDLIILSHVVEHAIDLEDMGRIVSLLNENGRIYIEVPDASRYVSFPRREYLYYIDRFHINHFSTEALAKLVHKWGLTPLQIGTAKIQYKDGNPYPVCFITASRGTEASAACSPSGALKETLLRYFDIEADKRSRFEAEVAPGEEIVVYGFGDNFFRSHRPGGPLEGYKIKVIVDLRWKDLSSSVYGNYYRFINMETAVQSFKSLPFVVTVSWDGARVREKLKGIGVERVVLL